MADAFSQSDPRLDARWPERFLEICRILHRRSDPHGIDHARGQLWLILNAILFRCLNTRALRYGPVPREELEDIAAQKALELLNRVEAGGLDLSDRHPAQVMAFVSSVAENGLMDLFRQPGRKARPIRDSDPEPSVAARVRASSPEWLVESKAYAKALRVCVGELERRARVIWFFRVFYEMTSKQIASHPDVCLKPGYVDVILQRVRKIVRDCMRQKGHDTHEIPPGVFAELWRAFRLEEAGSRLPA